MVSTFSLSQIEEMVAQLTRQEQLLLIERLAGRLREEFNGGDSQAPMTEEQLTPFLQQDASPERGDWLWEQSLREQPQITAAWNKAMKGMGISGEPVGAEELQKMFLECGVNPEENQFSRGIIEMREE